MSKKPDNATRPLLKDDEALFDDSYQAELEDRRNRPVECLGKKFPNDAARRAYFLDRLREHLKDPEFRKIEGFPIGGDEDILALSDPPYYTACPNPFINAFIELHGLRYEPETDNYRRKPFATDVSEGKRNAIYGAHSYHTKVPHRAIMRYILHYTEPGAIVLDVFAGTGMTGVASQMCASASEVQDLLPAPADASLPCRIGPRHAILFDIAPAATFIAHQYVHRPQPTDFKSRIAQALRKLDNELGWIYHTRDPDTGASEALLFCVWSDVFQCPECSAELDFHSAALDDSGSVSSDFPCPHCDSVVSKATLVHAYETQFDPLLNRPRPVAKQIPVEVCCRLRGSRDKYMRPVGKHDFEVLERVKTLNLPWHPVNKMMFQDEVWGDQWRRGYHFDVTHDYHFFLKRPLAVLAHLRREIGDYQPGLFLLTACLLGLSRLQRYTAGSTFPNMIRSGTLYIGSLHREWNAISWLEGKSRGLLKMYEETREADGAVCIGTQSARRLLSIPDSSVDYVFIDPPFGDNLAYSELNFLWEGWLRVFTAQQDEAIVSKHQHKTLHDYGALMRYCFAECFRVLKPGRWITVEFHNSRNAVWTSIQEAIQHAGFVVADVRVLDKQQQGFNAINARGAVNKDLVISAYRPNGGLEQRFQLVAGTEDGVWDFVRTHLKQLPVFISKDGRAETIAERQNFLLFDRMVAFHVQRGVTIPISASGFYEGLPQRFAERDNMYFLPDQVAEYDKKRLTVEEMLQLQLLVTDEGSAIQWLKQQLTRKPQTFQELHPQFLREIGGWDKHEKSLELSALLEENFLRFDASGEVPGQIHAYLSTNFKELRNRSKDDVALRAKGKDRWYVPDPKKAGDLEKLRERSLLREFEEYKASKEKRLKVFRIEAVRAGFKRAYDQRDYQTIVDVAAKIPESVLQEDEKLLMYYDVASMRLGTKDESKLF